MGMMINRRRVMGGGNDIDWSVKYLTFEALESGTFQFTNACEYSLNGGAWTSLAASTDTPTLAAGDLIRWRATITPDRTNGVGMFSSTGRYNAMGNPQSLLLGDNFKSATNGVGHYGHYRMFYNNTNLISAINLRLIDITWRWDTGNDYYVEMFNGCSNLVEAPDIEASILKGEGCKKMFYGCTSLVYVPHIASTTFGLNAFKQMFYNCSSLTIIPDWTISINNSAGTCNEMFKGCTSLTDASNITITGILMYLTCASMFEGCSSLKRTPNIATVSSFNSSGSFKAMFKGCISLVVAPELPNIPVVNDGCYQDMFSGCTSLTTSPILPATTLAGGCYQGMFSGCTSLTTAPELPALTLLDACYAGMFTGCTSLTTAPELPATTLVTSCYRGMFSGCTSLTYIKCLATDISANSCVYNWVYGVSSNGTFVKHPDMVSWTTGNSGIPNGWTVEDAIIDE